MESKKWYLSKTVWFNVVTVGLAFIQALSQSYAIPQEVLATIVSVGNILLRFISNAPIERSVK